MRRYLASIKKKVRGSETKHLRPFVLGLKEPSILDGGVSHSFWCVSTTIRRTRTRLCASFFFAMAFVRLYQHLCVTQIIFQ